MLHRRNTLPRWACVADAVAIALLLLTAFVAIDGGFVLRLAGIRVSVRSEWRPLLWAGILLLARHVLVREQPLHRRILRGIQAAARVVGGAARAAGPLPDDTRLSSSNAPHLRSRRQRFVAGTAWGLGIVGLFAVLTAIMTSPQVRQMDAVARNEGDALFSTWRIAWFAHQLPRDPLNLFNANIFHPEPGALAFSDAMVVPALMAAPLIWSGVPQVVAYNLLFLSGFALSGASMFLLVRSLTGNTAASLFAGFIFAFLPYRFMHYAHLELQMAQWMPLALWALHRTVRTGRVRDGLLTGLFVALQSLSSWYYGIFLCTFMVPVAGLLMAGEARRTIAAIRALGAGALLASVLIVPMAVPYLAARENVGERPESEIRFYSATPQNYLAAHRQNVLFGRTTARFGAQERELFMGFVVPLIVLVGLWPPLSAARIAYGAGLILAFDVSLGFNGILYPWLHEYFLPYRGLRVPARMAMVVGLALAILSGYGIHRLSVVTSSRRSSVVLFVALALGIAVEYRSVPMLRTIWTSPPAIYDALPARSSNVLLELPLVRPDISIEPTYMYFSTFHWNTLVNGYSGFSPPSYWQLHDSLEHFPGEAAVTELRRRGVTHVIVHGTFYRRGDYERLIARLEHCRDLQYVAAVPWHRGETRLYRLLPEGQARAGFVVK